MTTPTPTSEPRASISCRRFRDPDRRPGLCRAGRDRVQFLLLAGRSRDGSALCRASPARPWIWHVALRRAGLERGDRVAIVAETSPDFVRIFFACQYAGLVPVPLPLCINIGGHDAYVERLRGMLAAAGARLTVAPADSWRHWSRPRRAPTCSAWPRPPRLRHLAGGRRPGRAVGPRRALLHPVFVRQHELPARRAGHAARDRRQRACHRRSRPGPGAQAIAARPGCRSTTTWAWSAAA